MGDFLTTVHEDTVTFRNYVDPLLKHEDGKPLESSILTETILEIYKVIGIFRRS